MKTNFDNVHEAAFSSSIEIASITMLNMGGCLDTDDFKIQELLKKASSSFKQYGLDLTKDQMVMPFDKIKELVEGHIQNYQFPESVLYCWRLGLGCNDLRVAAILSLSQESNKSKKYSEDLDLTISGLMELCNTLGIAQDDLMSYVSAIKSSPKLPTSPREYFYKHVKRLDEKMSKNVTYVKAHTIGAVGDSNTVNLTVNRDTLLFEIDNSDVSEELKKESKSLLEKLSENPFLCELIGILFR